MHEPGMKEAVEVHGRKTAKAEKIRRFEEECRKGLHKLEAIHESAEDSAGCSEVVRWCPLCGSVVIDLDVDNRTQNGRIMPLRCPSLLKA